MSGGPWTVVGVQEPEGQVLAHHVRASWPRSSGGAAAVEAAAVGLAGGGGEPDPLLAQAQTTPPGRAHG